MPIQQWSDDILLVDLQDDPAFTDDMVVLTEQAEKNPAVDVLLDFAHVNYVNSSNLAKLLRLRKMIAIAGDGKLVLCSVNTHVWGLFLTTGLNNTFEFADDISLGLAALQIDRAADTGGGI